jgi:hypothetical protein
VNYGVGDDPYSVVTGDFNRDGKVYLEYTTGTTNKRKSCKVSSWPLTSQTGTGTGEIVFIIPKNIPPGQWALAVENGVGKDTTEFECTGET